jgi:hypothetical protein
VYRQANCDNNHPKHKHHHFFLLVVGVANDLGHQRHQCDVPVVLESNGCGVRKGKQGKQSMQGKQDKQG